MGPSAPTSHIFGGPGRTVLRSTEPDVQCLAACIEDYRGITCKVVISEYTVLYRTLVTNAGYSDQADRTSDLQYVVIC